MEKMFHNYQSCKKRIVFKNGCHSTAVAKSGGCAETDLTLENKMTIVLSTNVRWPPQESNGAVALCNKSLTVYVVCIMELVKVIDARQGSSYFQLTS